MEEEIFFSNSGEAVTVLTQGLDSLKHVHAMITYTHTHKHMCTQVNIHVHMYTCNTHADIHMHTQTHVYTQAYVRTHRCILWPLWSCFILTQRVYFSVPFCFLNQTSSKSFQFNRTPLHRMKYHS